MLHLPLFSTVVCVAIVQQASVEVEGKIRTVPAVVRKALNFLDGEILLSATGESCVLTLRPELAYTSQP